MQRRATHELLVVVALPDHAICRLAHHREGFDQDVVEVFAVGQSIAKLDGLAPKAIVGETRDLWLVRVDIGHQRRKGFDLASFAGPQDAIEDSHVAGSLEA